MAPFCSFGNSAVRMTAAVIAAKPMFFSKTSAMTATAANATSVMIWSVKRLRALLASARVSVAVPPPAGDAVSRSRRPCAGEVGVASAVGATSVRASSAGRVVELVAAEAAGHQLAAAEYEEQGDGDGEVEQQAGEEDGELVDGQVVLGHDRVGDDPVDADRGEPAGLRAVDHHHAHHQHVDAVAAGEAQSDGADDRAGRGAGGADGGQHGGDGEHHPGDQRHPAADRPYRGSHDQVDGAVVAGDGEQVGDPDEGQDEVAVDPGDDLPFGQAEGVHPDEPGGDEAERPHVDRQHGADDEQRDEREYRDQDWRHVWSLGSRAVSGPWVRQQRLREDWSGGLLA